MPYWKCSKCHHEWESTGRRKCDWCGADNPKMLEEETPFEKFIKGSKVLLERLKDE